MTDDVEQRLGTALRARADQPVDADALLAGALTAGRRRARRHRAVVAGSAAGAAGATAVLVALPLAGGGRPGPAHPTPWVGMPGLPDAVGRPGLAWRPDLVGSDPLTVHFDVPWAPEPVTSVSWGSAAGIETVSVSLSHDGVIVPVTIEAARGTLPRSALDDPATANQMRQAEVAGAPALIEDEPGTGWAGRGRWLHWQPARDVDMRVTVRTDMAVPAASGTAEGSPPSQVDPTPEASPPAWLDDATLVRMAESIDLEGAVRCSAPLRLTALPAGTGLASCTDLMARQSGGDAWHAATLMLWGNDGGGLQVDAMEEPVPWAAGGIPSGGDKTAGTAVATPGYDPTAGYPPRVDPSAMLTFGATPGLSQYELYGAAPFNLGPVSGTVFGSGSYRMAEAVTTADGARAAGDPDDPASWPVDPLDHAVATPEPTR